MSYGWVESCKHKPQPNRFVWLLSVMADDIPYWFGIGYWSKTEERFINWRPENAQAKTPVCFITHWQYLMYPKLETNKAEAIDPTNPPSGGSAVTPPVLMSDHAPQIIQRISGAKYILHSSHGPIRKGQLERMRKTLMEWWNSDLPFLLVEMPFHIESILLPEIQFEVPND